MAVYSKYWRKNRSHHEATELALGLRALRKVAGNMGNNVKPIFWKGMVEEDKKFIILDPTISNGKYPLTFKTFDILTGKVILEELLSLEWTEWVYGNVQKEIRLIPDPIKSYLLPLTIAAENIYINEFPKPHVFSLYLSGFLQVEVNKNNRDPELPPGPDSLAAIWKTKEIFNTIPPNLHADYHDSLEILSEYTKKIKKITTLTVPAERREKRIHLYLEMLAHITQVISEWEVFQLNADAVNLFDESGPEGDLPENDLIEEKDEESQEPEEEGAGKLEPELAEEVQAILEDEDMDLAKSIAVAVQNPEASTLETHFKRGKVKIDAYFDKQLVSRLKKIFKRQEALVRKLKRKRIRRGLHEGKLDARRLYRVPVDGRVFKYKEAPDHENYWQICIVADASASMTGKGGSHKPWLVAEKVFRALTEATKSFKNILDIYAYNAEKGACILTQLYHGGELFSVLPTGKTPSGQAILAAALKLDKNHKKSMIIHITDGASNCGLRLDDAVAYCQKNSIEIFTIGCGCNEQTRTFLGEYFPKESLYFLKNVNYLPLGLEYLFKQRILRVIK